MKLVEQSRTLLVDNQDYRAYAELTSLIDNHDNKIYNLKFKTVEIVKSEPMREELKFEMFLSAQDLARLKGILRSLD
jgi:hypothetical protein